MFVLVALYVNVDILYNTVAYWLVDKQSKSTESPNENENEWVGCKKAPDDFKHRICAVIFSTKRNSHSVICAFFSLAIPSSGDALKMKFNYLQNGYSFSGT